MQNPIGSIGRLQIQALRFLYKVAAKHSFCVFKSWQDVADDYHTKRVIRGLAKRGLVEYNETFNMCRINDNGHTEILRLELAKNWQ